MRKGSSRLAQPMRRRAAGARRFCALLGLIAFVAQSLLVQTHVHLPAHAFVKTPVQAEAAAGTGIASAHDAGGASEEAPAVPAPAHDASDCALCRQLGASGQFLLSAASVAALPAFVTFRAVGFADTLPALTAVSHAWHSRAPPHA